MKKHIYDERNGLHYTLHGDVYLPDLVYSKNDYPSLGKYGMLRKTYLKENCKAQYNWMAWQDTLWPHLLDIDRQAADMMDTLVKQMAEARGVTEQLKANDQWRWIQEMGNIRYAAEEIVLNKIIYQ